MDAYIKLKKQMGYCPNWEQCENTLKTASASAIEKMIRLRTACNIPELGKWVSEEDLQMVASGISLPIILIQRREGITTYTLYDSENAGANLTDPTKTARDIFQERSEAIFIYFDGVNHFQAVVPQKGR